MENSNFTQVFKGELKDLIKFFDSNYPGETFDVAFMNRKRLAIKEQIYSYDYIYLLYRSPDKNYVLFERNIG